MKKIFSSALAMVLALSLLAACGGDNSDINEENGDDTQIGGVTPPPEKDDDEPDVKTLPPGVLTMSITAPEHWQEKETYGFVLQNLQYEYTNLDVAYGTTFLLSGAELVDGESARGFVESLIENDEAANQVWKPTYTDIEDVTLGGHDALYFRREDSRDELLECYVIVNDGYAYIVEFSTQKEFEETLKDDLNAMLDSFTLIDLSGN